MPTNPIYSSLIKACQALSLLLLFCSCVYAQSSFPCETSAIGRLVTKNLVSKGKINYSIPKEKQDSNDFVTVFTTKSKENELSFIARSKKAGSQTIQLQYAYDKRSNKCEYLIILPNGDEAHIDEDGNLLNADLYLKAEAEKKQGDIKGLLKLFE